MRFQRGSAPATEGICSRGSGCAHLSEFIFGAFADRPGAPKRYSARCLTFDLTEELIRRRYSDADIRLVLGGNFRRLLEVAWREQAEERPRDDVARRPT